jgi:hypothetical protein
VYTQFSGQIPSIQLKDQILDPDSGSANAVSALIYVNADCTHAEPVSTKNNTGERPKKGKSRRRKKKGGYRSRRCKTKAELEMISNAFHEAEKAGYPLNTFITHRCPPNCSSDKERKNILKKQAMHAIQRVKGRGKVPYQYVVPSVTIYENTIEGGLHAHQLIHVADENRITALQRGEAIVAKKVYSDDIKRYLSKQRRPGSPEYQKYLTAKYGRYEPGEKIRGVHVSLSTDAKLLLAEGEHKELEGNSQTAEPVSLHKPTEQRVVAPFLARLLWQAPITVGSVLGVTDEDCRHRLRVPALATTRQPYRKEYACAGA